MSEEWSLRLSCQKQCPNTSELFWRRSLCCSPSPHAESPACATAVSLRGAPSCCHCYGHCHHRERERVHPLPDLGWCVARSQVQVHCGGIWLVEPRSYDFAWLQRGLGRYLAFWVLLMESGLCPPPKTHKVEIWQLRALDHRHLEQITQGYLSVNNLI